MTPFLRLWAHISGIFHSCYGPTEYFTASIFGRLAEFMAQRIETRQCLRTEFRHGSTHTLHRFSTHVAALRIEFIGIAYQPFKLRVRHIVDSGRTLRNSETFDISRSQPRTGVAFGHPGQSLRHTLASQKLRAQTAVGQIWRIAMTMDAWGVGHDDTDIMEHPRGHNLFLCQGKRPTTGQKQSQIRNRRAMAYIYIT